MIGRARRPRRAAALAVVLLAVPAGAIADVVSQGAQRIGADTYWSRGVTGSGQTVAVLDLAFGGLDDAIAVGELPPRDQMTLRSFDAANGLDGRSVFDAPYQHGTRMAEIVHDVAPGARLVLVNYHSQAEFVQAVDWIVANGIPVVSHSNSFITFPMDGTGRAARAVDAAAAAGVLWFNSAGNYAERHWAGRVTTTPTEIPLAVRPGDTLQFSGGWRGAPAVQVELAIERRLPGADWTRVAVSGPDPEALPRTDGAGTVLTPVTAVDAGEWRLTARTSAGEADAEVLSRTVGFGAAAVPAGSITTPGDAAGSVTVGAVRWTTSTAESYSSRGPTDDGRLKPDVAAPTYVVSNPAWPGTAGTSAATPHAAGAAALIRQERQSAGLAVDPASVRGDLLSRALDLGAPGPDTDFGAGMLRLDSTAPRLTVRIGRGSRPLVRVRVTDDGTVGDIRIRLRGKDVAVRRGPLATVRLPRLGRARAALEVVASDMSGNIVRRTTTLRGVGR